MDEIQVQLREAWQSFCKKLSDAGDSVLDPSTLGDDIDKVEGLRHLLRSLYRSVGLSVESSDVNFPELAWLHPFKFGQDNPDGLYQTSDINLENTYRLSGNVGTVCYVGITLMSMDFAEGPIEQLLTVNTSDVPVDDSGNLELYFTSQKCPNENDENSWFTLPEKKCSLFIRQFFSDWESEKAGNFHLECLDSHNPISRMESHTMLKHLNNTLPLALEMVDFWKDFGQNHLTAGQINSFDHIDHNKSDHVSKGGSPEQAYGQCWWKVEQDEALIYEVEIPECVYWGVQLGDIWYQSLDWVNRQSSLNGHQASISSDGVFRAVISHEDPGILNWLDTTGATQGCITYRWNQAESAPVPNLKLVPFEKLNDFLPSSIERTNPTKRVELLLKRRQTALKRFMR